MAYFYIDLDREVVPGSFASKLGVTALPSFSIWNTSSNDVFVLPGFQPISDRIEEFVEEFWANRLTPWVPSEAEPHTRPESKLRATTAAELEQMLVKCPLNNSTVAGGGAEEHRSRDHGSGTWYAVDACPTEAEGTLHNHRDHVHSVLVLFTAPGCGACQRANMVMEMVAQIISTEMEGTEVFRQGFAARHTIVVLTGRLQAVSEAGSIAVEKGIGSLVGERAFFELLEVDRERSITAVVTETAVSQPFPTCTHLFSTARAQ
eukprot:gene12495-14761_t